MLAETFDRMAESLEREEQLRKHLMANIAHELRTPLTVMKTHVEAMADGIVTDTRKGLDTIGAGIDRLVTLVKGIEDVTAAEAAFFTAGEKSEVYLHELLAGLAAEFGPLFLKKDLTLRLSDDGALVVTADTEKIERIVRNILSNALKFTDRGGVTIRYGTSGKEYFIEICDTGRGIRPDDIGRIFDRFYRSEGPETEGLGLGLAIVKELVEAMRGTVTVTSAVGQGSCFKVALPK
jgi:two-component system sensor histidine kinase BaeS